MSTPVPQFPVPALDDLVTQVKADLAGIDGIDQVLPVGVAPVLALIFAKLAAGQYAYLAKFPNRCLIPTLMVKPYLDRVCAGVGITRSPATQASGGSITINGTSGIPIDAQTQLVATVNSTQVVLQTVAPVEIPSGSSSVSVGVIAVTAGSIGNLETGTQVNLLTGIPGINGVATLTTGLSNGLDEENDASLQTQLAERLAVTPQGGAPADFVDWALSVNGVTRVWVYPVQYGAGTVAVTFMMDGRPNPVPLATDVTNVQAAIVAKAPCPPGSEAYTTFVCTPETVPVSISGLVPAAGYTTADAEAAITDAVAALNYVTTPGGLGWDSKQNAYVTGGTLKLNKIYAAISNAPGVDSFDLVAPTADITVPYGQITQLDAPTFS